MRPKLKHLRHPIHTLTVAKDLIGRRWEMWKFFERGRRHFAGDRRYSSQSVVDGFADRIQDTTADKELLERIGDSYKKAVEHENHASALYRASAWWEQQRRFSLRPVIEALDVRDLEAIGRMYRNFYRDPCSAGLVVAQDSAKAYFGESISRFHRRLFLIEALHRIDSWKGKTGASFSVRDLMGPNVGNPFGVIVDGTLVSVGSEYQHYCAHRIIDLLSPEGRVVAEVGGGFGGMAYYLVRDRPRTVYIDFDVPESIALASYYLLKAFPSLNFLLYGERELTSEAFASADVVLLPVSTLSSMHRLSVDLTFSSHAMSDLSAEAMAGYLESIVRMTRRYFFCIGNGAAAKRMSEVMDRRFPELKPCLIEESGWHHHRHRNISEVECTYQVSREPMAR